RPLVEERRHRLSVSIPAEPQWVQADPTRLEQILTNLLNNACKYTDPGGEIHLTVEREEQNDKVTEVASGAPQLETSCDGHAFPVRRHLLAHPRDLVPALEKPESRSALLLPACRLLVVYDSRGAAGSLAMLLGLTGQQVRAAYDGPCALALAGGFRPALAFF